MLRRLLPGVIALALALPTVAAARELPLGPSNLTETRTERAVTPGVTYTQITRGARAPEAHFTVDVAFFAERAPAMDLSERIALLGLDPRVEQIRERVPDDPTKGPLGYLVRVGGFATPAEAAVLQSDLAARGYTGLRVVDTAEDGGRTTGPWVVHVLEIEPEEFAGEVVPELGTVVVPGLERLSGIAARTGALAAMNGGYFVIGAADGTPGDLAGLSVIDGALVSEAVNGRTSLILPSAGGEDAFVATLTTKQTASAADGATRELDGLNRAPGLIRACGGSGGDVPTEAPKHDFTCTDPSELIRFTAADFGEPTPAGDGVEALLDGTGTVVSLREPRGGAIPTGGAVLAGTGDAAGWLRAHALAGTRILVALEVLSDEGAVPLEDGLGIVNGGPQLVRDGDIEITAAAEGFHRPEQPEFTYRFGIRRNPRTLAGVTEDGKLVFVAVDGRRAGYSVGASFEESARIMKALGAEDALNLDGGGSTTMTVGDAVVNRPSDAAGDRPIGDALLVLGP